MEHAQIKRRQATRPIYASHFREVTLANLRILSAMETVNDVAISRQPRH